MAAAPEAVALDDTPVLEAAPVEDAPIEAADVDAAPVEAAATIEPAPAPIDVSPEDARKRNVDSALTAALNAFNNAFDEPSDDAPAAASAEPDPNDRSPEVDS